MTQLPATRRGQGGRMAPRTERPLARLGQDFNSLFDRLWGGLLAPLDQDFEPVRLWDFDVSENDKEIVVRAEMPGFEENEVDVQLDNNVLTIRAEKEQKGDRQEEHVRFYRAVTLPPGIDADQARATYRNGVLELHIPRAEGAQPKRIQVQGQQTSTGQAGAAASRAGNQSQQAATGQEGQQAGNQAAASAKAKK